MPLLDSLPKPADLAASLDKITGSASGGVGLAGALGKLEGLRLGDLQASLQGQLNGQIAVQVEIDPKLLGNVLGPIEKALQAVPADPATLIAPIAARLAELEQLALARLPELASSGVVGLGRVEAALAGDRASLVANATTAFAGLKGELLGGAFAEIREWSAAVGKIGSEIEPLLAAGGAAPAQIIAWLEARIAALLAALLPEGAGLAASFALSLDAALPAPRIPEIQALAANLSLRLGEVRAQFAAGDFTATVQLDAALTALGALGEALLTVAGALEQTLAVPHATIDGLSRELGLRLDAFGEIEFVELGDLRQRFAAAIAKLRTAIEGANIATLRDQLLGALASATSALEGARLDDWTSDLGALTDRLAELAELLDAGLLDAVAGLRGVYTQSKESIDGVASQLGTVGEDGLFHFAVEQQLAQFLDGLEAGIDGTVKPLLEQFRGGIAGALGEVAAALETARGEVDGVKAQLLTALEGVGAQLETLDVPTRLEGIRGQLEEMIAALGEIDFDAVVDPVIAALGEMREQLAKIDLSAMSEISIGAFKVSAKVVVDLDFKTAITGALLAELEPILALPKQALGELEAKLEAALAAIAALEPKLLVAPVTALAEPLSAALDKLEIERLAEPLETWHTRATAAVEKVAPSALLAPLLDVHAQLAATVASLSPARLTAPLTEAVTGLQAKLQGLDLGAPLTAFREAVERLRGRLRKLAPQAMLQPLIDAFDAIDKALAGFKPSALLAPVSGLFSGLATPLAALTEAEAGLFAAAFGPLATLAEAFKPRAAFGVVRGRATALRTLLAQINVGKILADLRAPYAELSASFELAGPAGIGLSARVELLNPLRDQDLAQAAAAFQRIDAALARLAAATDPAADLDAKFAAVEARFASLVPAWLRPGTTAAQIRAEFAKANPVAVGPESDAVWDAFLAQWRQLDPRALSAALAAAVAQLEQALAPLDPTAAIASSTAVIEGLKQKVAAIDLGVIGQELEGLFGSFELAISSLDPRPAVTRLDGTANQVRAALAALSPAAALAAIEAPLDAAKGAAAALDPEALIAALDPAFDKVRGVLVQIDLGVLLEPLNQRLDKIRGELEKSLGRCESAFGDMLAALPV